MEKIRLGATQILTARLGFGAARIAKIEVPNDPLTNVDGATQSEADRLVGELLDRGITFIDTAGFYGNSEEMLGHAIQTRRAECVIATKAPNAPENDGPGWSKESIAASIDTSMSRLGVDYLDLAQLHSCTRDVIRDGGAIEALIEAKAAGKTRYIGCSGDGEDAMAAIETDAFDVLQTTFNIVDQRGMENVIPAARDRGMGVIAKRPVANGVFARSSSPYGYADEYWKRSRDITLPPGSDLEPMEVALRFTLSFDEIDVAILGTRNLDHAIRSVAWAEKGPLDAAIVQDLQDQFAEHGGSWRQI